MCDCLSYDDGSRFRCPICEDEAREAAETIAKLRNELDDERAFAGAAAFERHIYLQEIIRLRGELEAVKSGSAEAKNG